VKVLACHNRYAVRGGEDIAFDTAVRLWRGAGHQVRVFERHNARLAQAGVSGRLRAARRIVFDPEVYAELDAIVDEWRPRIAVVQNTLPLLSLAPYRVFADRGVPVVQVVYNYRFLCLNGELYTAGAICERCACGNYLHGVLRRCYRGSLLESGAVARMAFANRRGRVWASAVAKFVVPDHFLAQKLATHGLAADRFRVIPNPTELRPLGRPLEHNGTVLYVGRWTKAKGVFTLLDAALAPDVPPIVIVTGDEARAAAVNHPAVQAGRVTLVSSEYGDALHERMARVAAVVVPSQWYDNLPMVISQAFVAGRPVVASQINGIPEYVRDGDNGLLVQPGDVAGLAAALRTVVEDPDRWRQMAERSRAMAEGELGEDRWTEHWDRVFDDAA
jgi:glycosyltransferase involved in cell wall biosynthesis